MAAKKRMRRAGARQRLLKLVKGRYCSFSEKETILGGGTESEVRYEVYVDGIPEIYDGSSWEEVLGKLEKAIQSRKDW